MVGGLLFIIYKLNFDVFMRDKNVALRRQQRPPIQQLCRCEGEEEEEKETH